jgi:hypothetical protein
VTAQLMETRIRAGVWEGVLTGMRDLPKLLVTHLEKPVSGVETTPLAGRPGDWAVRVPIPVETLSDGVQTYLILDAATETRLAEFCVIAGAHIDDDIRAEVDLLRAELDLLKRAFRRHCLDTAGTPQAS